MRSSCCNAPIEEKFNNGNGASLCEKCRRVQEDERRDSHRRDEEQQAATNAMLATVACLF